MSGPLTYTDLKELAEELGRPLGTLVALAEAGDPFMAGLPWRKERAKWVAKIWRRYNFPRGTHIRRVHYVLVSQETPVLMVDGCTPYENTELCYKVLSTASRDARYLGLIPARDLDARRNDEPIINRSDEGEVSASIYAMGRVVTMEPPELSIPRLDVSPPTVPQPYHLEIWIEKTTMDDVLVPLGELYDINLVRGTGESSHTRCVQLVDRAIASQRPVRILYVSDFDPGGMSMPLAVARKVEFLLRKEGHDLDIQVRPIALTYEQCNEYRLPRTPIKKSERRAAKFEERFGEGATELDALEALRPGELARILEREIARYYDDDLGARSTTLRTSCRSNSMKSTARSTGSTPR